MQNKSAEYCNTLGVVTLHGVAGMIASFRQKPALDIAGFEAFQSWSQRLHVKLQHSAFAIALLCIFLLQNTSELFMLSNRCGYITFTWAKFME